MIPTPEILSNDDNASQDLNKNEKSTPVVSKTYYSKNRNSSKKKSKIEVNMEFNSLEKTRVKVDALSNNDGSNKSINSVK